MTPLDFARQELAAGVVEEHGNRGVPFTRYGIDGDEPGPWCARFVRWCYTQAGLKLPGQRHMIGRVATMQDELAKRGGILPHTAVIEAGDIVFLKDRGASDTGHGHHVAIVSSVGALTVNSIDGNWGDRVAAVPRDRHSASIWCFARWPARPFA